MARSIPGWDHLTHVEFELDGVFYNVTLGTVTEGSLTGERGVVLINNRAPWRWDDRTRNAITAKAYALDPNRT